MAAGAVPGSIPGIAFIKNQKNGGKHMYYVIIAVLAFIGGYSLSLL